jgi:hypothetical protein
MSEVVEIRIPICSLRALPYELCICSPVVDGHLGCQHQVRGSFILQESHGESITFVAFGTIEAVGRMDN